MDLGGGSLRHWCPQSQGQMAAPPGRVGVDTCLGIDAEIWVEGCISQLPRALPWVQRILLGVGVLGPQDWEGAHWRLQAVLLSAAPRDSLGLGLLPGVLRAAVSSPARLVCGSPWGGFRPCLALPPPRGGATCWASVLLLACHSRPQGGLRSGSGVAPGGQCPLFSGWSLRGSPGGCGGSQPSLGEKLE